MAKKNPTGAPPKSSHTLWDNPRSGELKDVQAPLALIIRPYSPSYEASPTELKEVQQPVAQIAWRHDPTARNCHEPWQKSRGRVQ